MAAEFYIVANSTGSNTAPVSGKITQIIYCGDQLTTFWLDTLANKVMEIRNPTAGTVGVVVPVNIPVKAGQKIGSSAIDCVVTVTGQGA